MQFAHSRPPVVHVVVCGYKDYTVNVPVQTLVSARLHQGFGIKSVGVVNGKRGSVVLVCHFLPRVSVIYTLKFKWTGALFDGCVRVFVELNIVASKRFVYSFISNDRSDEKV